ncbi:helix-turn-helix domain-containing protein [Acetivibrio sp. MSJd-27]|jgi:hypothetical protein|nr:helix-turn-helix domain-containing protein [Acetivibrio sp. MSJd-27]
MDYMKKFKTLRTDNDYSQEQIAKILGVAQTTYSQYERGVRALPIEHFITLCRFYHISSNSILGLQENKDY